MVRRKVARRYGGWETTKEKSGRDPADIEFWLVTKYALIRDLPAKTLFNMPMNYNQNREEGEDDARRVLDPYYNESK